MNWQLGTIILPGDLQWIDEIWQAAKQAEDPALNGGVIIQRSRQVAGRPMTLQTPPGVFVTRQQVLDLSAFHDDENTDVFTVTHPDAREFQCRFRHGDGQAVDADNTYFLSPPEPGDAWHTLTLRMMTV